MIKLLCRRAVAALLLVLIAVPAVAADVIMYRKKGCPYCLQWDKEIGTAYPKTELGKKAPIRMVDLSDPQPPVELKKRVIFTPTFVLVEDNKEVARIEGYVGQEFFWDMMEELVAKARPTTQ